MERLSWLIWRVPCNHEGPYKREAGGPESGERLAGAMLLALKTEEGAEAKECGSPWKLEKVRKWILPQSLPPKLRTANTFVFRLLTSRAVR